MLSIDGTDAGTVAVPDEVFAVPVNHDLIAQAIYIRLQNARLATRKTKDRGEVRGGGAKPWRQKGTGRARHGSTRSPIWRGGGHVHALRPGVHNVTLSKAMRRGALVSSLSGKHAQGDVLVVQGLAYEKPHTKTAKKTLAAITDKQKALLVTADKDTAVKKSFQNIPGTKVREARLLHAYEIVWSDVVIFTKEGLDAFLGVVVKD